ncbi:33494fea-24e0-4d8b-8f0c-649abc7e6f77 [Thermothielavioides terrestris]|uniref:33494fea-24e0-4d8b-8f0c-649abc7e6f77 n=1 Tax=Thermothielavioides terrestris TaxID=2587410 RepID=A0A3S4AM62_9PEZI|nr:33494fea-24e0-4d8b-8f0c-649abc7e6f77 [Thermothielavioides terrestris]
MHSEHTTSGIHRSPISTTQIKAPTTSALKTQINLPHYFRTISHNPRQLLRMRPGTGAGALQAHGGLVLDVGAQHLGRPAVLGLDVDVREVEVVAGRRAAAVDRRRHVVPARARDVLPADVADGEVGGVAVLHVRPMPDRQRDGPPVQIRRAAGQVDPRLPVPVEHGLPKPPQRDVPPADPPRRLAPRVRRVHDLPDVVRPRAEDDGAVLAALGEGGQDLRGVVDGRAGLEGVAAVRAGRRGGEAGPRRVEAQFGVVHVVRTESTTVRPRDGEGGVGVGEGRDDAC